MRILFFFALINLSLLNLFSQNNNIKADSTKSEILMPSETETSVEINDADFNIKQALYQRKVESYTKMKKAGITMGISGAGMIIIGSVMTASADWEQYSTSSSSGVTTNDPAGVAGLILIVVGVPLTVTGIVLGSIGAKKQKYYGGLLENLTFNLSTSPQQTGLKLTYRF